MHDAAKFHGWTNGPREALRWRPGDDVRTMDCAGTPGFKGDRPEGEAQTQSLGADLSDLQERLFANGKMGDKRSVLLVLQGLDTAGKGGIVRHVVGMVDPQGVSYHSFGVPTPEEAAHGYLWRIRNALPIRGHLGVFDRSHFEQVLVVRVNQLEPEATWRACYDEINEFEAEVTAAGTTIVKVAMMVSKDEQKARLTERFTRPDKHWKLSESDVPTHLKFADYLDAYQEMLEKTSTDNAPWFVVPANKKWFARLAVTGLLVETLGSLNLEWPQAKFDVVGQRRLLDAS